MTQVSFTQMVAEVGDELRVPPRAAMWAAP